MNFLLSLQALLLETANDGASTAGAGTTLVASGKGGQKLADLMSTWDQTLGSIYGTRLDKRLAWDGIESREQLLSILADMDTDRHDELVKRRFCDCINTIQQTLSDSVPHEDIWLQCGENLRAKLQSIPFIDVFLPLVLAEYEHLVAELNQEHQQQIHPISFAESLALDLGQSICLESCQILYQHFNQERSVDTLIQAHQDGRSNQGKYPAQIYNEYCQRCRNNMSLILEAYPVLATHLAISLENWRRNSRIVIDRIREDWREICDVFNIDHGALVTGIRFGEGDHHAAGQSVAILDLLSEGKLQNLLYKPRNMAIDLALNQCIDLANSDDIPGRLRGVRSMNKHTHGYCEYIDHKACESDLQLREFYRNFGRLAALLHCLGATDCHYENIIASAVDPVLVDAETLFEPLFASDLKGDVLYPGTKSRERVDKSIMRTMLIPRWFYATKNFHANELTALGVFNVDQEVVKIAGWLAVNSDGMMPGQVERPAKVPNSLPVGVGAGNPLPEYGDAFIAGFRTQIESIAKNKALWLSDHGGILAAFRGIPRRLVFRATSVYGALLDQARSPKSCQSMLHCSMVYESMARAFVNQPDRPANWPLFHDECDQMAHGDIPFFWSMCDGKEILNHNGQIVSDSYIAVTGLEDAEDIIQGIDDAEIEFQIEIIHGSLVSRFGSDSSRLRSLQQSRSRNARLPADLLDCLNRLAATSESVRILRHLLLTSIPSADALSWLGAIVGPDLRGLSFGILDDTAAIGASGIGLFFAFCCHAHPELASYGQGLALSAMRNFLTFFDTASSERLRKWWIDSPAGLCGTAGAFQLFSMLGALGLQPVGTQWDSFADLQEHLLAQISADDLVTQPFDDVYTGLAGLVAPLLNQGSTKAVDIAVAIGHALLRRQSGDGFWRNNGITRSGFGHGNAGIAAALAVLYGHTGEKCFRDAAWCAITAENTLRNPEATGWRDLRYGVEKPVYSQLWCQGSSGIALSRLILLVNGCGNSVVEDDLRLAVLSILNASDNGIDDLCCGVAGMASCLRILAEPDLVDHVLQVGWSDNDLRLKSQQLLQEQVRVSQSRGHYRTMIANGNTELLSLMTGLAGIGLCLLEGESAQWAIRWWMSAGMLPPASAKC